MGTVYNQSERNYRQTTEKNVELFCQEFGINPYHTDPMVRLRVLEVMEYKRRTDFLIDNGDRWDEQIAGIAKCLDRIADALENFHQ
jgi:hypothetical protein